MRKGLASDGSSWRPQGIRRCPWVMVRVFPCSSAIFPHVRPASLPFKGRGGDGVRQNGEETHPPPLLPPPGGGEKLGKGRGPSSWAPPLPPLSFQKPGPP